MIYVDFPYYQDFYCGTSITDAAAFRTAAARASEYIDSITFGRLQNGIQDAYTEQVKNCCCALSEAWVLFLDAKNGILAGGKGAKTAETISKYSGQLQYTSRRDSGSSGRQHGRLAKLSIPHLHAVSRTYRAAILPTNLTIIKNRRIKKFKLRS